MMLRFSLPEKDGNSHTVGYSCVVLALPLIVATNAPTNATHPSTAVPNTVSYTHLTLPTNREV